MLYKRCIIASLMAGVFFLIGCSGGQPLPSPSSTAGLIEQTKNLATGTIVVQPGKYQDIPFNIEAYKMSYVTIDGWFHASGGSQNDIEIFIVDDDTFSTWKQNRSVKPIYNSGRKTIGDIEISMPAKTTRYHLVFNNVFSNTLKYVQVQIDMNYYVKPTATPTTTSSNSTGAG